MIDYDQKIEYFDADELADIDNAFAIDELDLPHNTRIAVRYLRDDISLAIKADGLLNWRSLPDIKLKDISSNGAYISSSAPLKINKQLTLIFEFKDGKQYQADGTVVYNHPENSFCYGFKFKAFDHQLGDYLLYTQKKLLLRI